MELIIFASLYQAKEVLYFSTHFFIEESSIYVPSTVTLHSLYIKKASAVKNLEVSQRSQEPLSERGSERLNHTSSGCIRLSHYIVMHKWSF